jgi:hypothetical protein
MATVFKVTEKDTGDINVYKADTERDLKAHLIDRTFTIARCSHEDLVGMIGEDNRIVAIPSREPAKKAGGTAANTESKP